MIFGKRSLQELTIEDFEILIQNRIPEGPFLKYKEVAYSGQSDGIQEMLSDITSIANAEGGYIIMGIKEDSYKRAESFTPIPDAELIIKPMRQACKDGINEKIENLEFGVFDCSLEGSIIVIRIPQSPVKPHMVSFEHHTDFYRRYETDKQFMTYHEIRSSILSDPTAMHLIELELLQSGKVVLPGGQYGKKSNPPYVRIFKEKSVDQFLQKYFACTAYPQNLVIVSPFISDLSGEAITLQDLINKVNQDETHTYIITRTPKETYQFNSIAILEQSPFIEIRYNEDIHAKLYICWCRKNEDKSFVLFGSGNLTTGGMRHNLELGMMIYSQDYGRTLVRHLYDWSMNGLRSKSKRIKKMTARKSGGN